MVLDHQDLAVFSEAANSHQVQEDYLVVGDYLEAVSHHNHRLAHQVDCLIVSLEETHLQAVGNHQADFSEVEDQQLNNLLLTIHTQPQPPHLHLHHLLVCLEGYLEALNPPSQPTSRTSQPINRANQAISRVKE